MPNDPRQQKIAQVVSWLRQAESVLVITGAGISAESGLPTYRGIGGLYNDLLTDDDIPIEVALSGITLATAPQLTWTYLAQIEQACRGATFNRAHQIIAQLEAYFGRLWVLTQNVDGFHRAAGSQKVIDIHGDLHNLCCMKCDYRSTVVDYSGLTIPPPCPRCQQLLRPDVVLFGELLPPKKVARLQQERHRGFDLVFTIGTSSLFPYIANPVIQASQCGIPTVEINPDTTEVTACVAVKFACGAVEALTAIWAEFQT